MLLDLASAHPVAASLLGVFIVLKVVAKFGGTKPGTWTKPPAGEYAVYDGKSPVSVTDPKGEMTIRYAKAGIASLPAKTVPALFKEAAAKFGSKPALKVESDGQWLTWTWAEYHAACEKVAKALVAVGIGAHDAVNVIGFNSPEWFMAEMGAIMAGGKAAGVYTTNEASACQYVAEHSEARVVFLEDEKQLAKYLTFAQGLKKLICIVMWKGEVPAAANGRGKKPVYSWAEFVAMGSDTKQAELDKRAAALKPGHCATLIYTSGTTGNPKAVMVSHDNLIYSSSSVFQTVFESFEQKDLPEEFRVVSYLPLSHVAAQMLDLIAPLVITADTAAWSRQYYTTWFARPDALKGTLKNSLVAARPTVFLGVPRVWEKIKETLLEVGRANSKTKQKVAGWAKRNASAAAATRQLGGTGERTVGYLLAKKLILSKIKAALGLDQALICLTGAAPMPRDVSEYFASLDLDLLDVYGMSESTGATTIGTPPVHQFGSVGAPIGPDEVKCEHVAGRDKPTEGEICYRGRHIMMGYMKEPKKTDEAIDKDGWLHSGDVGTIDADGLLHITGRLKELIITAGGENIAPVPIEDKLKELRPAISNVMMVGDKRKYNVVLVTAKTALDPETGLSTGKLVGDAARVSKATTSEQAAAECKDKGSAWYKYLMSGLEETNGFAVSNAQKLQKFALVPGDFSERGGELTATLKLKRGPTTDKYIKVIDALY